MTEPEIKMWRHYLLLDAEEQADYEGLGEDIQDLLEGRPSRHPTPPSASWPTAYDRLLAVTDGLVREIVELHRPKPDSIAGRVLEWQCRGCEWSGREAEPPEWPCETTGLIASRVGVDLGDAAS